MSMTLKDAVHSLNVNDDSLWTADGQPRIEVLKDLTGAQVTRAMIMSEVGIISRDALRQPIAMQAATPAFTTGLPTSQAWNNTSPEVIVDKSNPNAESIDTSSLYTQANIQKHREDLDEEEIKQPPMRERVEMLKRQIADASATVDAIHTKMVEIKTEYDAARAHLTSLHEMLQATDAHSQDNQAAIRAMLAQSQRAAEAGEVAPINKAQRTYTATRPVYIHNR